MKERYALVTGTGSGLGRALALRLARDGWRLALADVDAAGNAETLALVLAAGGRAQCEPLDVADLDSWRALRARLEAVWPRLDLLVNNAGVGGSGLCSQFSLEDWRWMLDINLLGAVNGCHVMIDWLKANPGRAHLVNVASIAGLLPLPATTAYSVSKAGLITLSECLFSELRPHGVGVTVACPGFFRTRITDRGRYATEFQRRAGERLADGARLTADRVAAAIVRGVRRRRLYVVVPLRARMLWRLKRWLPRLTARLLALTHVWHQRQARQQAEGDAAEKLTNSPPDSLGPAGGLG